MLIMTVLLGFALVLTMVMLGCVLLVARSLCESHYIRDIDLQDRDPDVAVGEQSQWSNTAAMR